jgi:hypothetical protein
VDFNRFYFEHQLLLLKAQHAVSPDRRRSLRIEASAVAGRIGRSQRRLGAGGAPRWQALAEARA